MTIRRPLVNIVNVTGRPLFTPHFDPMRDGYDVVENDNPDTECDLLVVFEALATSARFKVRGGGTLFVSGEPPDIGGHTNSFLHQFDAVYCAGARPDVAAFVSHEQHYNNWHFGYSTRQVGYRYSHAEICDLPIPEKTAILSTVTSNLNYLPMHIRRRALIARLANDYPGRIDIFGRPHHFVEYKEDAILPYRFHLCIENCAVPGLWTEKIADALLSYAVPVYAGCTNIDNYFPGATIAIDLDDYASTRRTIDTILEDGEALYRAKLDAVKTARRNLIREFDISSLVRDRLRQIEERPARTVLLRPEAAFPLAKARNLMRRVQRKVQALAWQRRVARHG